MKEKNPKLTKMIVFCVCPEDHSAIKIESTKRNMSMREFILTAVNEYLRTHPTNM